MDSVLQPARALVDPTGAVPSVIERRRFVWPLLILMAAVAFSGAALATRWDAAPTVVAKLSATGELAGTTERELASKITTTARIALVGGVARGIFLMPLIALLLSVGLKIAGWLVGRSIGFGASFTTVSLALLPTAAYHLLVGVVALSSTVVVEPDASKVVPSHLGQFIDGLSPALVRLASVVDFFNLWAVALLGLGYAAATGMRRGRALLFALVLYLAWAGVFLVGLPGMGGGR